MGRRWTDDWERAPVFTVTVSTFVPSDNPSGLAGARWLKTARGDCAGCAGALAVVRPPPAALKT